MQSFFATSLVWQGFLPRRITQAYMQSASRQPVHEHTPAMPIFRCFTCCMLSLTPSCQSTKQTQPGHHPCPQVFASSCCLPIQHILSPLQFSPTSLGLMDISKPVWKPCVVPLVRSPPVEASSQHRCSQVESGSQLVSQHPIAVRHSISLVDMSPPDSSQAARAIVSLALGTLSCAFYAFKSYSLVIALVTMHDVSFYVSHILSHAQLLVRMTPVWLTTVIPKSD